ncbi:VWA domain-containing protein [Saccharothrix longispora]|uniref:VWFA domain-containing protein n=1 Tax=Saccharothrix longispora TaxID=33920 RepID=A0ABU1PU09_9PSEU|nr:VWA domain-containing protein [Saccharothrix longispora]MDR6593773.1 hypothetical protein [Saccharothrix longispora]
MAVAPEFAVEVRQNEHLPAGAGRVEAVVTVTATGGARAGPAADAAEVLVLDTSGSMRSPPEKLAEAVRAAEAALGVLRDGVRFAVVAGTDTARVVYPPGPGLAVAGPRTRAAATRAVRRLRAAGGTAMGRWLLLADALLSGPDAGAPDAGGPGSRASGAGPRHAILLTDGENRHESPQELAAVLERVAGRFTCDCRGVGTDWRVAELRGIAEAMLGTVDIVADPAGLARDFESMTLAAMGKAVADVSLRLWTPGHAEVVFLRQVAPALLDLTGRRRRTGPRTGEYPTGAWAAGESRDYHLSVRVRPAAVGERMLAARIALVGPGEAVSGRGRVLAVWTDDAALSTRIPPEVAHYTGQAELAEAIREGLRARRAGDAARATARLGRAVRLAHESGNTGTAKLLAAVVEVRDAASGTVRLRADVTEVDEMTLDTRSTVTKRVGRD